MLADQCAILLVHPFSLFALDFDDVDFFFVYCRHVHLVTTPFCFQFPRILCWSTGPPFPILFLFFFLFFFSDRPTQNQKTHSTINEKKGGGLKNKMCLYLFLPYWGFSEGFYDLSLAWIHHEFIESTATCSRFSLFSTASQRKLVTIRVKVSKETVVLRRWG